MSGGTFHPGGHSTLRHRSQKIDAGGDEKQGILFTWPYMTILVQYTNNIMTAQCKFSCNLNFRRLTPWTSPRNILDHLMTDNPGVGLHVPVVELS